MTSKAKLISLVSALEVIGETKIKKDVVKQYKEDILKDLEILEILKNQIDIKRGLDTFSKKPVYVIEPKKFAFALSEEKGRLIKEWSEK